MWAKISVREKIALFISLVCSSCVSRRVIVNQVGLLFFQARKLVTALPCCKQNLKCLYFLAFKQELCWHTLIHEKLCEITGDVN